jgi:hypothetical protein
MIESEEQFKVMDIRYRWKNGAAPSRDQAAHEKQLLDESQFTSEQDHKMAEETARKKLGVPLMIDDEAPSVLPKAAPDSQIM